MDKWASYDKRIQCANNYTKDADALKMVQKAVEDEAFAQSFKVRDETKITLIVDSWERAFESIN